MREELVLLAFSLKPAPDVVLTVLVLDVVLAAVRVVAPVVLDSVQDLRVGALRVARVLFYAQAVRLAEAVHHLRGEHVHTAELLRLQLLQSLEEAVAEMIQSTQLARRGGVLQDAAVRETDGKLRVVGVVQSGKQRAVLDAVRLEVLEPEEHSDDREELGVGFVAVDEEVLFTLARMVVFPSGEAQLDERRDAFPGGARLRGDVDLVDHGAEVGEEAPAREGRVRPEQHRPHLLPLDTRVEGVAKPIAL